MVVGSLNYDVVFDVDRFPREHEKLRANGVRMGGGGSAANTSYWLARLGHTVELVSTVGDDILGSEAVDSLTNAGVALRVVRVPGATTGVAAVSSRGDEKRMITSPGPAIDLALDHVDVSDLRKSLWVHIASKPSARLAELASAAAAAGARVSVDFNGRDMSAVAVHASLGFLNLDEWELLTGEREPTESAAKELVPNGQVVVTLGSQGALSLSSGGIVQRPAARTVVVDRTGGGDAFDAGFLDAVVSGLPVGECLDAGLELASQVLRSKGAHP